VYLLIQIIYAFKGTVQDKIFLSMGTSVRGYTKKGRMFLSFDTGLLESIKCMWVDFENNWYIIWLLLLN